MSPANPTGAMIARDELARICAFCDEAEIVLVSDEIYHGLEYEMRAETALRFSQRALVVNSFSKYYAMTGLAARLARRAARIDASARALAAVARDLRARPCRSARRSPLSTRATNWRRTAPAMRETGRCCWTAFPKWDLDNFAPPDGAFYIYADISRFTDDSIGFCRRMLHEAGVATTPGLDFDPRRGAKTLRLSYAGPEAEVA